MSAMSNYLENKLIDFILRGEPYTPPATVYLGLFTDPPTDAGGGVEVTGGSYARASIACSLANWAGTQSAGSTVASNGTGGLTSNNVAINFPAPTANWGTIVAVGLFDQAVGGNLLFHGDLTVPKTVNSGDPASSYVPGACQLTFA